MSRKVTAPDGTEWAVARRWAPDRPRLRDKDRDVADPGPSVEGSSSESGGGGGGGSGWDLPDFFDDAIAIALVVGAVVLVVLFFTTIVLPLLVLLIEVVLLAFLLVAGLFGRVVLRRPWTVRAVRRTDRHREEWRVSGFRRSGALRDEVADSIRSSGRAEPRLPTAAAS